MQDWQKTELQNFLEGIQKQTGCTFLLAVIGGPNTWGIPTAQEDVVCVYSGERLPASVKPPGIRGKPTIVTNISIDDISILCSQSHYIPSEILVASDVIVDNPVFRCALETAVAMRSPMAHAKHYADELSTLYSNIVSEKAKIRVTDYLNAMRLALSVYWLEDDTEGLPPIDISTLVGEVTVSDDINNAISYLFEKVSIGIDETYRMPNLDLFLSMAIHETMQIAHMLRYAYPDLHELNKVLNPALPSQFTTEVSPMAATG